MKTIRKTGLALLGIAVLFVQSCTKDELETPIETHEYKGLLHDVITITNEGLFPGKFDFNDANKKFVVGSLTRSEVGYVHPITGRYKTFIKDENLATVTGIHVDEERNRLIVASGDLGFSSNSIGLGAVSYLGVYNMRNGKRIAGINFKELYPEGTPSFANDIAVADNGHIYVTDSFNPIIFEVDNSYQASIFLDGGEAFANAPIVGIALNGLAIVDDYLIVSKTDDGSLFRIPLSDPTSFTKIDLPLFLGADGLEAMPNGDIILVETGIGGIAGARLLTSDDDWISASTASFFEVPIEEFPASATLASDGEVYILSARLSTFYAGNPNHDTFNIYRVQ